MIWIHHLRFSCKWMCGALADDYRICAENGVKWVCNKVLFYIIILMRKQMQYPCNNPNEFHITTPNGKFRMCNLCAWALVYSHFKVHGKSAWNSATEIIIIQRIHTRLLIYTFPKELNLIRMQYKHYISISKHILRNGTLVICNYYLL